MSVRSKIIFALALVLFAGTISRTQQPRFHLQEATIDDVHRAIRSGQLTCSALVKLYINRAKAYNGVSNELVTRDGVPIPSVPGVVRAGAPIKFPTETIAISTLLPDFDQYAGPPIEFGRMEPTASDPAVQQQYGMTVGIPNSGQVNALGTLNLRGERSVTCKGDRDKAPSAGPAARRIAAGVRRIPQAAGCAGARRGTRRAIRPQSRSARDADVLHSVFVQGSVRHQRHAQRRRRRRPLRHRFPGARPHAGRRAAQERRDHLRQGRQSPNTTAARSRRFAAVEKIPEPNRPTKMLVSTRATSAAPGPAIRASL